MAGNLILLNFIFSLEIFRAKSDKIFAFSYSVQPSPKQAKASSAIPSSPGSSSKISLKKKRVINPKYACQTCNFKTTDQAKLDRHIVVHELEDQDSTAKEFKCRENCDFETDSSIG